MKQRTASLVVIGSLVLTSSVLAHHSDVNYATEEWTELQGTVRAVHWVNPHAWIYLEVMDAEGQAGTWALEGAGTTALQRSGWTQDSVEVGDEIAVRCHQLRSGARGCLLGFIEMDDGSWKEFD